MRHLQPQHVPIVGRSLRGYKANTAARSMIFPGVLPWFADSGQVLWGRAAWEDSACAGS
ncbi:MAG: hypothetical protein ACJ8BW_18725 [Ktedonobacteraceae bacterium]